jgi:hypothetical protein
MTAIRSGPGALAGTADAKHNITGHTFSPSADREQAAAARGASRRARLGRGFTRRARPIDFGEVNRAALAVFPPLLARWLPGGRIEGAEYVALNPRRADHRPGSFRINTRTGRWADFAIEGARGGDVVSLAAYLGGIGQREAAGRLAATLGIGRRDGR